MAGGRPTSYKPEYAEQAKKLCLLGSTDKELADFFNVAEATLNNWKLDHPEFLESLREGKELADANVASRLYQRAMGYEHPEVDLRVIDHEIVETPITKIYPPDATSAIFWLKNRQRARWRDKVETGITDTEGKDVPPSDPQETARRIAFLLAKAVNKE